MLSKLVKYTDLLGSYEILLVRIDPGSIHSRIGRQTVKFSENSSDLSVKKCSENFFVGSLRKPLLWELFSWEQFKNHCSHNFSERAEEDLIGLKKTQSEWEQSHCSEQNERPLYGGVYEIRHSAYDGDFYVFQNHVYKTLVEPFNLSKFLKSRAQDKFAYLRSMWIFYVWKLDFKPSYYKKCIQWEPSAVRHVIITNPSSFTKSLEGRRENWAVFQKKNDGNLFGVCSKYILECVPPGRKWTTKGCLNERVLFSSL